MDKSTKQCIYITSLIYIIIFIVSSTILPLAFGNIHNNITYDQLHLNAINNTEWNVFSQIIFRNILVSFVILALGILGTDILSIIILSWNAYYIGELINAINKPDTINAIFAILPHAIIEIPIAILATAFACNLALKMQEHTGNKGIIGVLTYKGHINEITRNYLLKPYFTTILPLVIISCIIESTISLYILKFIFNG